MPNATHESIVVVGMSFHTTELSSRSRFAFNADACRDAYTYAAAGLPFFILSTCNRTEIYGHSHDLQAITTVLQRQAQCSSKELDRLVYVRRGNAAVQHFFRVAAGLDSQIIGDYDIIAQIKSAFQGAKSAHRTNGILEKLLNFALQASKQVKNTTSFSDGTLSVPYAAVREISERSDVRTVTVVGAGDTGELVVRYLRSLVPGCGIRLVNRDEEKLHVLGARYDVTQYPITALRQSLVGSDALIVTTNAPAPIVDREHVEGSQIRVIFDLSVPRNVSVRVYNLPGLTVFDTDSISQTIDANLNTRLSEIPKVESIVADFVAEFENWVHRRDRYTSVIESQISEK